MFGLTEEIAWEIFNKRSVVDSNLFAVVSVWTLVTSLKFTVVDVFQGISITLQTVSFQNNFKKPFLT